MSRLDKYLNDEELNEGSKKKYIIMSAGDGFAINGPMKPGQKHHEAPQIRSYADDGLFDSYRDAWKKVNQLGGVVYRWMKFNVEVDLEETKPDMSDKELEKMYSKRIMDLLTMHGIQPRKVSKAKNKY